MQYCMYLDGSGCFMESLGLRYPSKKLPVPVPGSLYDHGSPSFLSQQEELVTQVGDIRDHNLQTDQNTCGLIICMP